MNNEISKTTNLILHLIFIVITVLCVLPIVLVFMISITDYDSIVLNGYQFIPDKLSLEAYRYIFKDYGTVVSAYGISFFVTIVGTLLSVLLTSLYAYPLSRGDFRYRNVFAFLVFFTMLFSGGLVPWYIMYTQVLDLKNSIWALIFPMLLSPFNVLIMKTYFQMTVPPALIEAAKIDGAGELRTFFRIVFPLSLPVFATIGLFNTLHYWNDWFNSMIFITDTKLYSLQYLMYKMISQADYLSRNSALIQGSATELAKLPGETIRMAMALIGIGPIVLAYPFFQRYFIKGLTIGSIKG
ncbi:carbohydrate ABC transporter permease [Paenibacillus sp. FSL R5-0527]|uniref:carbohydrate ABC transporter permease n=1 Tax=Paenibacillus TaxID=44249 RepID=UPI00097B72C6|nr:carbohydrate ABC transporter permease [Paenibacillus macerans]MED4957939.1 carbohydrate ABC transporter permease [Paenibacillus macerans]OMG47162.1 sugar ABC transporter permease [Paenibacillus macerans]